MNKIISFDNTTINSLDELFTHLKPYKNKLCVIQFSTSWCGPCKNIKNEIIKEGGLASTYKDNVVFVYIDIEKHQGIANECNISSVPIFKFILVNNNTIEFPLTDMTGGNKNKLIENIKNYIKKK